MFKGRNLLSKHPRRSRLWIFNAKKTKSLYFQLYNFPVLIRHRKKSASFLGKNKSRKSSPAQKLTTFPDPFWMCAAPTFTGTTSKRCLVPLRNPRCFTAVAAPLRSTVICWKPVSFQGKKER